MDEAPKVKFCPIQMFAFAPGVTTIGSGFTTVTVTGVTGL